MIFIILFAIVSILFITTTLLYKKELYNKGTGKEKNNTVFIFGEPFVIITSEEWLRLTIQDNKLKAKAKGE